MAHKARRDIWEARGDVNTADGRLCWCAAGGELKFTCKMRLGSVWAGCVRSFSKGSGMIHLHFRNVNQLLEGMNEVLVWLPGALGVVGCCCSRHRGGSQTWSYIIWVGPESVNGRAELPSEIRDGFEKNPFIASIINREITNVQE